MKHTNLPPLFMAGFMKEIDVQFKNKQEKAKEARIKRKNKLVKLFKEECGICHMAFKPYMYDFHHINPKTKVFKLSGANLLRKWSTVLREAHKCKMVCPNCHRYLHYKQGDLG